MHKNGQRPAELRVDVPYSNRPDQATPDSGSRAASGSETFTYRAGAYPSRSSLDSPTSLTSFDDVRLTAIPSPGRDPERVPSRYEDASPLRRSGTALMSVSRKIRRVSVRVVNFAATDHAVRLEDDEIPENGGYVQKLDGEVDPEPIKHPVSPPSLGPLRGRTLGFLSPNNKLRLAMYKFLIYKYVLHHSV
jgi:hypothetical protein